MSLATPKMPPSSPPPPKRFHHFLPIATPTPAPELYTTLKTLISQNPSFPPEQKSIILALLSSPPSPTYTSTALLALLNTHGLGAAIHIIHQGLQFLRDGRRAYAPLPAPTTPATCLLTSHADSQQPLLRCEILPTSTRDRFRADCFWTLVRLFWEPELVAGLKEWCESAEAEECVENRIVLTQDAGAAFDRLDFVLEPVLGGAQVRWVGELHETLWACGGEGGKPGLVLNGAEISFEAGSRPDAGLLHIRAVLGRAAKRCGASGGLSWHCDLAGEDEVSEGTEMYTDSEDDDESWEYDTNSSVSTGDGLAERWCETLRDSRKEVDE